MYGVRKQRRVLTLRPVAAILLIAPHKKAIKYYDVIWHHPTPNINPFNIFSLRTLRIVTSF